jgi:hypothetical protein
VPVEGRVHVVDRAVVRPSNGANAGVVELAVIHDQQSTTDGCASEPFASFEVAHHRCRWPSSAYSSAWIICHQLLVMGLATF